MATTSAPRWPPRSPHEALLSSPSGRSKLRRHNNQTSPSPSPLKKSATTPNLGRLQRAPTLDDAFEEEEDEDEETLQLRLDAVEARLKLKKLRQKKAKAASADSDIENDRPSELKHRTASIPKPRQVSQLDEPCLQTSSGVQIPLSPVRKQKPLEEAKSPSRVLLGIDKGLKGRNVSLRKPPVKQSQQEDDDPFSSRKGMPPMETKRRVFSNSGTSSYQDPPAKSKTFSERIAETRQLDKEQKERANKIRRQKSTGFGIKDHEIADFKKAAEDIAPKPQQKPRCVERGFSREEVIKAAQKPNGGLVRRDTDASTPSERRPQKQHAEPTATHRSLKDSTYTKLNSPRPASSSSHPTDEPSDTSLYDPFSSIHLSKRIIPNDFLTRTFSTKPIALLPDLLGTVKSPTYSLPSTYEPDFIVLGIIASKSPPFSHKDTHKSGPTTETTSTTEATSSEQNASGKYMVLTLTDLKWTLDLYLFTTAYTRFWKLTPGTLVAILNPSIMPPPPGKADTGRFSLVLNSSDDTVLEIGTSRDLGWCKSVKRDGKQCGSWVDKRHTSVCEFHVDRVVERTRAGRMEVNGLSAPYGPKGKSGGRTGFWGGSRRGGEKKGTTAGDGLLKEGERYDRHLGSSYFIAPRLPGSFDRSAASLLDAEVGGMERGGSKEERARKRLAEQEKEREIAKRLGEGGNGMAAEYLRSKHDLKSGEGAASQSTGEPVDARELGLVGNKAVDVHLSPLKKRKAEAMGSESCRKNTRFVTSKGIKEAGRESGGGDIWLQAGREESEDELEVV